jgi:hypothetical protein
MEALDDRELPSVMAPGPVTTPARLASHGHLLLLSGTVRGNWTAQPSIPDTGTTQSLAGRGRVQPLGKVHAQGTLQTPGFILTGRTTGVFTLKAVGGSVTVDLVGPPQPGFSDPPSMFNFTIVGSTGRFRGATGSGTATFHEAKPPTCPPGTVCPQILFVPTFTFTFRPESA